MNMPNHFHRSARQNGGDAAAEVLASHQSSQHTASEQTRLQEYVVQPYLVQSSTQPCPAQPISVQQARRAALYVLAACLISAGFSPAAWSDAPTARSPRAQAVATNDGNMLTGLRWQQYSRIAKHNNREKAPLPVVAGSTFKPQSAHPAVGNRSAAQSKAVKAPATVPTAASQPAPLSKAKLQQAEPAKSSKPVQAVKLPVAGTDVHRTRHWRRSGRGALSCEAGRSAARYTTRARYTLGFHTMDSQSGDGDSSIEYSCNRKPDAGHHAARHHHAQRIADQDAGPWHFAAGHADFNAPALCAATLNGSTAAHSATAAETGVAASRSRFDERQDEPDRSTRLARCQGRTDAQGHHGFVAKEIAARHAASSRVDARCDRSMSIR
jgi:hypothetical protein